MVEKVPCHSCQKLILPSTAKKNRGLCYPCCYLREQRRPILLLVNYLKQPWVWLQFWRWKAREKRLRQNWPKTIEEAVLRLATRENPEAIRQDYPDLESFLARQHFRLGLHIRNYFGLWGGNEALLRACATEDPDVASGEILAALWRYARQLNPSGSEGLLGTAAEVVAKGREMSVDEVMLKVGDRYLVLHRENYLDEPDGDAIKLFMRELAQGLSLNQIRELLRAEDWRVRIVGIYCVLVLNQHILSPELRDQLLKGRHSGFDIRPICLALALLEENESVGALREFLLQARDPDALVNYAAALKAMERLGSPLCGGLRKELLAKFQGHSFFTRPALEESEKRFEAARVFWKS